MSLTQDKLRELKDAFEFSDRDGNGRIDFLEFVNLVEDFGMFIDTAQAQAGFETLDTDDDGMIDFDEFIEWWQHN